ncbi:hypothetical protein WU86_12060 [Corynebacterium xerosis]|nr:hypothetical protein WU86_12060 [Corynebacterium xerosis]
MFAVMAGAGLMLIWMARAAASGKLKRNSIAGIRTSKTMASEEAWRAAHVRTKTLTMIAGAVSLIGGVIALLPIGIGPMMFAVMVATGITFGLVTYTAIIGGRAADEVTPANEG